MLRSSAPLRPPLRTAELPAAVRASRTPARSARICCKVARPHVVSLTVEERLGVTLSPDIMRLILGDAKPDEKLNNYEESLHSWWMEYADRKNHEDHEHVSDSLLYDERCHLPRTTAPPPCVERIENFRRSMQSMSSSDD